MHYIIYILGKTQSSDLVNLVLWQSGLTMLWEVWLDWSLPNSWHALSGGFLAPFLATVNLRKIHSKLQWITGSMALPRFTLNNWPKCMMKVLGARIEDRDIQWMLTISLTKNWTSMYIQVLVESSESKGWNSTIPRVPSDGDLALWSILKLRKLKSTVGEGSKWHGSLINVSVKCQAPWSAWLGQCFPHVSIFCVNVDHFLIFAKPYSNKWTKIHVLQLHSPKTQSKAIKRIAATGPWPLTPHICILRL